MKIPDLLPDKQTLQKLNFRDPSVWIATWFGCGLMRPAPGTWGTLGALPFGIALMALGGPGALLLGLCIITPLGYWASGRLDTMTGEKDSSIIVIDEAAGLWVALLPAALAPVPVALAFILFRAFDILKPWPVSWLDKNLPGAAGVMADDIMAGIYAALILIGLHYAQFL